MMENKGFVAGPLDLGPDENTFSGTVAGLRDVNHFEGSTAQGLKRAFRASIDCYLDFCREAARKPPRKAGGVHGNRGKKQHSGAKAPLDLRAKLYGLKPVPSRKPKPSLKPSRRFESAP